MWEKVWRWADVKRSRCEDEQMWEKMWRWADVKMSRCERRCEDEQMWRWADVKMSRCERRCEDEQMWRWADVREDVREDMKMSRWEKMWEKMWRWADVREDVKMSRCEDEQMWRWADVREDVKMSRCESRCERRCEDEQMWKWEGVREGVKMRRWRWEGVKMRRWDTDPHYWKNPALRRSREKPASNLYVMYLPVIKENKTGKKHILYKIGISDAPLLNPYSEQNHAKPWFGYKIGGPTNRKTIHKTFYAGPWPSLFHRGVWIRHRKHRESELATVGKTGGVLSAAYHVVICIYLFFSAANFSNPFPLSIKFPHRGPRNE